MRTRSWRRYKSEVKLLSRMKGKGMRGYYRWSGYIDANGNRIKNSTWMDVIGTSTHFMFKTYTTKSTDSKHKDKYGKKGRSRSSWNNMNKGGNRETNKVAFKRMLLVDYGIKDFNINYGFTQVSTEE